MALEIPKIPDLWRWGYGKMPIYGVRAPLNHFIMALEISKTPDLWREGYKKMPIYGVSKEILITFATS